MIKEQANQIDQQIFNVLLVEDDMAHAMLIGRALEDGSSSWKLHHASTLAEAESMLAQQQPDIMLLDNHLPDGSGVTLLPGSMEARIFPIIMMTAFGDEKTAVTAMKSGALDYIVKSDHVFEDMPYIMRRSLREWGHISDRRRAEESLRRFEHIVSTSGDMIAMMDREFTYLTANPKYLANMKISLDALVGRTAIDILGESYFYDVVKPNAERCFAGGTADYQRWVTFPDEEKKYLDVHYYPYLDINNNVVGLVVNARDITQKKNDEQAIRDSEEKFRSVTEAAQDAIIMLDNDGEVSLWNPAAERIFGYYQAEILGKDISTFIGLRPLVKTMHFSARL